MARWLVVGDVHAVEEELEDCENLKEGILATIRAEEPDYLLFLGDQHHNHKLLNVNVMAFWNSAFQAFIDTGVQVVSLVGNHDMPGDVGSKAHAMMAYQGLGVKVISIACTVGECLLVPYIHDNQAFLEALSYFPDTKTVFCHQTFDGATYDNGFYAKDGVLLKGLDDRTFISGHIHTPTTFANVTYVGAPRWKTVSDANIDRSLVLFETTSRYNPAEVVKTFDTSIWCQKILLIEDREDTPSEEPINPRYKYVVDIHGSEEFIKSRLPRWAGCRVRTFKTRTKVTSKVTESMGIGTAVKAFVSHYEPKFGTPREQLLEMVSRRLT